MASVSCANAMRSETGRGKKDAGGSEMGYGACLVYLPRVSAAPFQPTSRIRVYVGCQGAEVAPAAHLQAGA